MMVHTSKNLQVVYTEAEISNYEEIDKLSTGSSIRVVGKLKLTPEGKQPILKLKQLRLKSKVNVMKIFHYKRNVIHSNICVKYRI